MRALLLSVVGGGCGVSVNACPFRTMVVPLAGITCGIVCVVAVFAELFSVLRDFPFAARLAFQAASRASSSVFPAIPPPTVTQNSAL